MGVSAVGSPTTISFGVTPIDLSQGAATLAPCIDVSSSHVTRSAKPSAGTDCVSAAFLIRFIATAMNPFMSQAPNPYALSSRIVSVRGAVAHRSASQFTVSECPVIKRPVK